ncbi:hypothetical protein M422DRAFT_72010 [Sphaerobolus stellatus SS14]|uniref:DUF6534 domain-containing protein n=1 Tax=Sphaerobolus stellatus (strain SS14) TaxID=990650 RepID=A0A0C9TVX1_SPHS4|nr:hypothetical protein M422DRAFT_72010 [Sphaerobolus stellatus SS14]
MAELLPHIDIKPLYGPALIGLVATAFMSGLTSLQTFLYYRQYPRDHLILKLFVGIIWILDTAHLAIGIHFVYYYTVLRWGELLLIPLSLFVDNTKRSYEGDPTALAQFPWSWGVHYVLTAVTTCLCQFFLIYRVYMLSSRGWFLVFVTSLLTIVDFGIGITIAVFGFNGQTIRDFEGESLRSIVYNVTTKYSQCSKMIAVRMHEFSVYLSVGLCVRRSSPSAALTDTMIATSLTWHLMRQRTKWSAGLVDKLIIFAIGNGILTRIRNPNNEVSTKHIGLRGSWPFLSSLNIRQMLRTTKPPENSKDAFSITIDHNGTMRAVNFATASASGTASANEVFCMDNLVSVKEEGSVVDIRPTKELSTEVSVDVA